MQNLKSLIFLKNLILPFLFLLSGCAMSHAPQKWLPDPDKVPTDPYGSWIETEYLTAGKGKTEDINGELIAIQKDTLFLLMLNDSFRSLPVINIKSARLVKYTSSFGAIAGLTLIGSLSTVSNGWGLIFTFPIWLIGGTISASARSYDPMLNYPKHNLKEFVPYARFPQGLPANLIREALYPKNGFRTAIAEKDTIKKDN